MLNTGRLDILFAYATLGEPVTLKTDINGKSVNTLIDEGLISIRENEKNEFQIVFPFIYLYTITMSGKTIIILMGIN